MHLVFNEETNTGKTLNTHMSLSLREYLREITPEKGLGKKVKNLSRKILLESIEKLLPADLSDDQRARALTSFSDTPMMQLADGSNLLYDTETFLTNYIYQTACRERNISFLFTQQCSRSKMMMNSKATVGSGFLDLEGDVHAVFDVSRSRLSRASIATLKGPVKFEFNPLGMRLPSYAALPLPDILQELKNQDFPSAADAVLQANQHIWTALQIKGRKKLIQFDERLSGEIVRRHIDDQNSPIYRMLFDPSVRKSFVENQTSVVDSPKNLILKDTTNFFFYVDGETVRPAKIHDGKGGVVMVDGENGKSVSIDFSPNGVQEALREGVLFPDLALSYIALSILPGTLAFGGASQHEYLPQIARILDLTNDETKFLEEDIPAYENSDPYAGSRMICGLVEVDDRLKRIISVLNRSSDLKGLDDELLDKPLSESLGDMHYFDYFDLFLPRRDNPSTLELKG